MRSALIASALYGAAALLIPAAPAWAGDTAADAAAPVPAVEYRSVFSGYRKPQFESSANWRQANDAVRDVGGHTGAMKDASDAAAHNHGNASAAAPAAAPAHGGHVGHRQ